jgi:cell shape-determining protein MreD
MCLGVTIGILLIFTMVVLLVILKSSSMQISDVLLQSSVIGCAIALAVVTLIVMYLLVSEVFMKIEESVEVIGSSRNGKGCQGQGIRKENGRERKGLVVEECA